MSYEIINSDCLRAMQEMPDGCIDAIVTDPPYGLAFMGANWDHNVPSVAYWSECLRVAKSGAHLLCFGGTRTFHRLMCAIEDAGWEIRDTIMWVYGCLDEETEVLVDGEFVPYNKAKKGRLALGYDIERGTFSWQRIEDTYLYDYDDTAYAIQSDSTDQLVSRNHRCIVERGGVEQFALAELVALEREASVPVLEGLHSLFDHLPLPDERVGDEEQDVLEGVPVERGSQALRELWGAKTTLARVTPVHYEGKMWCIKVRTGAFVARRHGKIFITGNSGFPKSMDVGKAIDKALGKERQKVGERPEWKVSRKWRETEGRSDLPISMLDITEPASNEAKMWDGWGTCLKPAWEPIIVARKPLDGTVAHNVLTWGVGALNIDGCRVPTGDKLGGGMRAGGAEGVWDRPFMHDEQMQAAFVERKKAHIAKGETLGRFPANLVHDGSQMVLDLFPDTGKSSGGGMHTRGTAGEEMTNTYGTYTGGVATKSVGMGDTGSAARFFYCAKASKKDRNYGCERLLTWEERDQELTQLLEQASSLLARDISESMMLNLVEQGCSTSLFGNENTVLSQEECRFITSTVIPLITASKTCSSSPRSNTSESILDAIRTSEESGISLARLADKSSQSRQDSTSGGTDTATSAASALFGVLSEIRGRARVGNFHCTVKPISLMEWLVKLVTPDGGVVLDPFAGSGTTLLACKELGRSCIGIEREPEYVEIIKRRLGE